MDDGRYSLVAPRCPGKHKHLSLRMATRQHFVSYNRVILSNLTHICRPSSFCSLASSRTLLLSPRPPADPSWQCTRKPPGLRTPKRPVHNGSEAAPVIRMHMSLVLWSTVCNDRVISLLCKHVLAAHGHQRRPAWCADRMRGVPLCESGTFCCHFVNRWRKRARCSIDLGVTVATVVLSRTIGQLSITLWSHRWLHMICESLHLMTT